MGTKRFSRNASDFRLCNAVIEALEIRRLLAFSISGTALEGPVTTAGNTWNYAIHHPDGSSSVEVITVGQPTTFMGKAVIAATDNTTVTTPGDPPKVTEIDSTGYGAVTAAGPVFYGATQTAGPNSGTLIYTPYDLILPATLTVGVANAFTYRANVDSASGPLFETVTTVNTLVSEDTTSIEVDAGTFDCYAIAQTITVTSGTGVSNTKTDTEYAALGTGVVEKVNDPDDILKLTSLVRKVDTLKFQQGPSETIAGNNIKPPVIVEIDGPGGGVDATGGDATDFVTLKLNGTGTLGGTLTVQAVAGIATFSDLMVDTAGTNTLQASSGSMTAVTSGSFTVDNGTPSELSPTLPRLKVPTTAVGGGSVNINAPVDVTNETDATVTGSATVSAFLVGPNNPVSSAVHPGFIATPDTVSLQIGKTVSEKVNLKPHKSAHINVHLTKLPQVPTAGSYTLEFQITDPKGTIITVMGPSIVVGPPTIALTETISSVKIPASTQSNTKLKNASIKLIVKNSGNVSAKGKTTLAISASSTAGVVGTSIGSQSIVLNTAPNKTKPVTLNVKSLPQLAAGNYFIVIQATDSMGGTSVVSSANEIAITA